MARLDYKEYDDACEELRALYDHFRKDRPQAANIHRMIGNSIMLMGRYAEFVPRIREESVIERKLRELAILTVARVTATPYVWNAHARAALDAGATEEELEALGKEPKGFDDRSRAALAYTAQVAESGHVTDETFADLRRHFDAQAIVELTMLAGAYLMVTRFLTALQVDLQPPLSTDRA